MRVAVRNLSGMFAVQMGAPFSRALRAGEGAFRAAEGG
jgi:hypothetical protein